MRQSQRSGHDRLQGRAGECSHVDCRFQYKREMCKNINASAKKVYQDSKNPST